MDEIPVISRNCYKGTCNTLVIFVGCIGHRMQDLCIEDEITWPHNIVQFFCLHNRMKFSSYVVTFVFG